MSPAAHGLCFVTPCNAFEPVHIPHRRREKDRMPIVACYGIFIIGAAIVFAVQKATGHNDHTWF
jgi:hypothetical protein